MTMFHISSWSCRIVWKSCSLFCSFLNCEKISKGEKWIVHTLKYFERWAQDPSNGSLILVATKHPWENMDESHISRYKYIYIYIDILYICIYNSHFLSKTQGTTSVMALATCQATQRSLRLFWGVTLWMVSPDHEDPWRPKGILYVFLERMMFLMAYLPDLYHKGQRKNVGVGYGGFFFGGCLSLDAFRGFFSPLIPETWMMILLIEENVAPPNIYETL